VAVAKKANVPKRQSAKKYLEEIISMQLVLDFLPSFSSLKGRVCRGRTNFLFGRENLPFSAHGLSTIGATINRNTDLSTLLFWIAFARSNVIDAILFTGDVT